MSRPRAGRGLSVLLVEDDGAVRRVIRDMLRWCGCTVCEAADAGQALDALARSQPDVVLLDARLPGMDGLELLEKLSASGAASSVPVIATTGTAIPEDAFRARGARGVLRKPFSARELRRVLHPFRSAAVARGPHHPAAAPRT